MFLGLPYSTWIAIAIGAAGFVGRWMWRRRSWKWRDRIEKKLDARLPPERKRTVRFMPSAVINMLQSWVLPAPKDEPSKEGETEPGGEAPPKEPPQLDPSDLPRRPGRPQDDPYPPPPPDSGIGPGRPSPGGQPGGGCNPRTPRGWWAGGTARPAVPDTTRSRPKHYEGRGAAKRPTRVV